MLKSKSRRRWRACGFLVLFKDRMYLQRRFYTGWTMKIINRFTVGALTLSATGLVALTQYEGFRSEAYIPVEGDVPTIGFGTTDGVQMGDTISVPEALNRLQSDVRKAEDSVKSCVTVPLTQNQFDAFTSLSYNIGGSAFCNSTLVRKLNSGDYQGACAELKRWIYVDGRVVQGLVNRREAEYQRCIGALQ